MRFNFLKRLPVPLQFFLYSALLSLVYYSCTPAKRSYYFRGLEKDTTITGFIPNTFESKIQAGDFLSIQVTSLSSVEDALFNQASVGGVSAATSGYKVEEGGTVLLHRLGEVQVAGLTRKELSKKLQRDLLPYMKEPIVNVNFINRTVTVIGEVGTPKMIEIPGEQIPLLDVLVLSGDIAASGRRDKIVIIREQENQKQIKYVNLEDLSIFSSPFYYVRPNDIIYVLADEAKTQREDRRNVVQRNIGYITAGITFLILIVDRLFR